MSTLQEKRTTSSPTLPFITFAGRRVSRLILGNNPISGVSHYSTELSNAMENYFSMENAKALLRRAEELGVTAFQGRSDRWILHVLHEHRQEGGNLHFICQTATEMADLRANMRLAVKAGAIAIYHHGTETDNYWAEGRIEELRELMKSARDLGVAVGIGSHKPEVIEYVEEKGWDVDFYMTSFYNVYKHMKGRKQSYIITGVVTEDCFEEEDRERMCKTIQNVSKTCLAFKILGAGRNSRNPGQTEKAFGYAFDHIKSSDAVVVGMYPNDHDQVRENVELTLKYGWS